MPSSWHSRASTRIDLAGGTLDLWPLYLFVPRPLTINLGIDLYAEAELREIPDGKSVRFRSDDQGAQTEILWKDLFGQDPSLPVSASFPNGVHPAIELPAKLVAHFARARRVREPSWRPPGLELVTRAKSPAGAGLGGSSTLNVALCGLLSSWAEDAVLNPARDPARAERLIEVARDVETTVIKVPAGVQDYYGAMFGGLQELAWGIGSHRRRALPDPLLQALEDRLVLFYSGQSRNSGINNWAMFKNVIDNVDPAVRAGFDAISRATERLGRALEASGGPDWLGAVDAVRDELAARRRLAPGITTPAIDFAFRRLAELLPPDAPFSGKVCGAGGGGCFFFLFSSPPPADPLARLETELLATHGIRRLPFHAVPRGLEVTRREGSG